MPRIRLERNMMSPPQRYNSSLEKSTDLYGNYKARDYNTEARLASSQDLIGKRELKLPMIKKKSNQSLMQKRLNNQSGYTLMKSDWERTYQNK